MIAVVAERLGGGGGWCVSTRAAWSWEAYWQSVRALVVKTLDC